MHIWIAWIAGAFSVGYAAVLLLVWRYQERIVFQPPRILAGEDVSAGRVTYPAADGTSIFAYVVGDVHHAPAIMLAFHGNADLARWLVPWAQRVVASTGVAVVLPEYRGYAELEGSPTYTTAGQDARSCLEFVRDTLEIPASRLVYFGHSLGSAIATELAIASAPRALILQSPFTSARAMASRFVVPGLARLWPVLSRVQYDTVRQVHVLGAPVWVAHGERDALIPPTMGRDVFEAAATKGDLLIVPGAGHNDVPEQGGASYWRWLAKALLPP